MDLNFELILTVIFLIAAVFWLLNKFMVKQAEGPIEFMGSHGPGAWVGVGIALLCC